MVATMLTQDKDQAKGYGCKTKPASHFSWADHMNRLSPSDFKLRYRLDPEGFDELLKIIADDLKVRDEKQSKNSNWGVINEPHVKLAVALRFLAGGQVLDLKLIYHLDSKATVYRYIWQVVDAINLHLKVDFPYEDVEKLKVLEGEFRAASIGGMWSGQVMALDGVHFKMLSPSEKDVPNPMRYHVARKGEYALLCMAGCDAARRFQFFDISQAPTTHDSMAWSGSTVGQAVMAGKLPGDFFVSGDAAFSTGPSVITPSGEPAHDDFDYHQSSNRMPIECAFGILVRRWGIFWRPLSMRFDRRALVVEVCMKLHNFCIDRRIHESLLRQKGDYTEVQPRRWVRTPLFDREGRPVEFLDILRTKPRPPAHATALALRYAKRDALVQAVADSGLKRPALKAGVRKKQKKRRGRKPKQ